MEAVAVYNADEGKLVAVFDSASFAAEFCLISPDKSYGAHKQKYLWGYINRRSKLSSKMSGHPFKIVLRLANKQQLEELGTQPYILKDLSFKQKVEQIYKFTLNRVYH